VVGRGGKRKRWKWLVEEKRFGIEERKGVMGNE